jgi:O-Antigen ligase
MSVPATSPRGPVRPEFRGGGATRPANRFRGFARPAEPRTGFQQRLVYFLWAVLLCDPQFFLAHIGLKFATRLPLAFVVLLVFTVILRPRKSDWLVGIFAWLAVAIIDVPFAVDPAVSLVMIKALILLYAIGIGILQGIRTPKEAGRIVFMLCVVQWFWWATMGLKDGFVSWHPNVANADAYGPLMAIGVGPAYYYAAAVKGRRSKLALLAAGLCVVGVVSAFARGAVLSLITSVGYIWLRSPRKGRTTGYMVAALVLVAAIAPLIDGTTRDSVARSNFWDEMSTMFDKSEGSTGDDRLIMWAAGVKVFKQHPLFGAGADNFGPTAATTLTGSEVGGYYADNPMKLYSRDLHNIYYQILSEFGLAGVAIYLYLLVQFWRRGQDLSTPAAQAAWQAAGGVEDVRSIALGLQCGMVAFLASGYFYNQLYTSWSFSLIITNTMLWSIAVRNRARAPGTPVFANQRPR